MKRNEILVMYGNEVRSMTDALLDKADIASEIPKGARIGLKPNLVVAKTPDSGATTHTSIVEAVIRYLQRLGYKELIIVESAWVGDSTQRAFKVCGYDALSRQYGVPLADVKKDSYHTCNIEGLQIEMSDTVMGLDYLISLPVLKGHCQTTMTCALKNMKGCISDRSKRYFHTMGLHHPIACLNKIRAADLVIVDALNGDLDFEEGGNPVQMNRMMVAKDSVLLDSYGATLMGYRPEEIKYISIAQRLGVGSGDLTGAEITELNKDTLHVKPPFSRKVERLEKHVRQDKACSACYANLIQALARLDDRGVLGRLPGKIHIGQGYKGCNIDGIGVGSCTAGCKRSLRGCPPKALDIIEFIKAL